MLIALPLMPPRDPFQSRAFLPNPSACGMQGKGIHYSYKIPQNPRKAATTSGSWKSQETDADTLKQAMASGGLGCGEHSLQSPQTHCARNEGGMQLRVLKCDTNGQCLPLSGCMNVTLHLCLPGLYVMEMCVHVFVYVCVYMRAC